MIYMRVARLERFELPTPWFVAKYSIQLSYRRADKNRRPALVMLWSLRIPCGKVPSSKLLTLLPNPRQSNYPLTSSYPGTLSTGHTGALPQKKKVADQRRPDFWGRDLITTIPPAKPANATR